MCTLIMVVKKIPSFPIVIAGNRDEFLVRRSLAPHLWPLSQYGKSLEIFAGRDLEAGGTWFGINPDGMIAGITNQFTGTRDPKKLSRGQLVLGCLSQDSLEKAHSSFTSLDTFRYNPFNLFCMNRESGFFYTNHPEPRTLSPIEQGIHVLTNQGIEDHGDPKKQWILNQLENHPQELEALETVLIRLLRFHGSKESSSPLCVHLDGYGTVSSFLLALGNRLNKSRFFFWDGPSCKSPRQDLSSGLKELFHQKE